MATLPPATTPPPCERSLSRSGLKGQELVCCSMPVCSAARAALAALRAITVRRAPLDTSGMPRREPALVSQPLLRLDFRSLFLGCSRLLLCAVLVSQLAYRLKSSRATPASVSAAFRALLQRPFACHQLLPFLALPRLPRGPHFGHRSDHVLGLSCRHLPFWRRLRRCALTARSLDLSSPQRTFR